MAIEQVDNHVVDNIAQKTYANELESHNPYDVAALDSYAKKGGTHNIAAVLNLIQHLIDELHSIADSVKTNKAIATEQWTKQTQLSAQKTKTASYGEIGKSIGALVPGVVAETASDVMKFFGKDITAETVKKTVLAVSTMGGTMFKSMKEAEASDHMHNSQQHQGDKEGYAQANQTMDQSLQSAIEGLRGALNTLGNQNKEAAGR